MKNKIQEAKAFVGRHKVAIACVTGATVGVVITRKIDTRVFNALIYNMGREAGVLELQNTVFRDFIFKEGLKEKLLYEFIPTLGEEFVIPNT